MTCPRCQSPLSDPAQRFCMQCGEDLAASRPLGTPWERRETLGLIAALVETTKRVLAAPASFFREMPIDTGLGAPIGYAVILGMVGVITTALYRFVLRSMLGLPFIWLGTHSSLGRVVPLLEGGVGLIIQVVLGPLLVLTGVAMFAVILHLMLLLLGGARRGFEATLRVVSYAQATAVFHLLPFCGDLIAPVYLIVLSVIGLSEAHRIGRGTAAAAVLLPLLFCCCLTLIAVLLVGSLGAFLISRFR